MKSFTCKEVFERLQDYLDRELTKDEVLQVEAHLADCKMCSSEYTFEQGVLRYVTDSVRDVEIPEDLSKKLREFILTA